MNVLLVEDNPMDIELMHSAFRDMRLGGRLHVSTNGAQAIDYVFGRNEYADRARYPFPDLVLLDLKMPGLTGHDVLHSIKTTLEFKRLPVVILTSSTEETDLKRSYDYGANSYLVKPVSYQGFLMVMHQVHNYWLSLNLAPPAPQL